MSVNIRLGKTLRNHVFKILWQFTKTASASALRVWRTPLPLMEPKMRPTFSARCLTARQAMF
jgi:hypothetical protein